MKHGYNAKHERYNLLSNYRFFRLQMKYLLGVFLRIKRLVCPGISFSVASCHDPGGLGLEERIYTLLAWMFYPIMIATRNKSSSFCAYSVWASNLTLTEAGVGFWSFPWHRHPHIKLWLRAWSRHSCNPCPYSCQTLRKNESFVVTLSTYSGVCMEQIEFQSYDAVITLLSP